MTPITHFVLTPVGSGGDVRPFAGIGRELVRRGHRVTLMTAEPFRRFAEEGGMRFVSTWPAEEYERQVLDPDLWHPRRGIRSILRIVAGNLERAWSLLDESVGETRPILVAHSLSFPTRSFGEKNGLATATIHLAPGVFRSRTDAPVVAAGLELGRLPAPLFDLFWRGVDRLVIDPPLLPAYNRLRADHGLPPVSRLFGDEMHRSDLLLGLFPEWFARPQPEWPRQTKLTGFPLVRFDSEDLTPSLDAWLLDGPAPIVFTAGTANRQASGFFNTAIETAGRSGRRALLLTGWREQIPPVLPQGVRYEPFAPLHQLLPRAAALVHHGGIGTCASGLAAGAPQVVMPMAFDQLDNAARLERLGVGVRLSPRRFEPGRLSAALESIVESGAVRSACAAIRDRMAGEDGIGDACDELERLAADRQTREVRQR
ncbi:MAG: glycosyltransferase [Thermoanaerobaculia bacterium]